jgi:hypothetical protein
VVANAASDVKDDVIPPELRVFTHKPEPVLQSLRRSLPDDGRGNAFAKPAVAG